MAGMRELSRGLWHWTAPHPDWQEGEAWDEHVSSYAADDGARLLLFDPLGVPRELEELAADRETAIVLTCPWHERDARRLVERLGTPVFTPPPESAQDLMDNFGVTAEQAGEGSPDVRWLVSGEVGEGHFFAAGDRLPIGVEAFPGSRKNDLVLWVASQSAVILGDTIIAGQDGPRINPDWLPKGVTREQVVEGLLPLLELPVEHVLTTHGGPHDRAALERALA
jgi:hypothetical protein